MCAQVVHVRWKPGEELISDTYFSAVAQSETDVCPLQNDPRCEFSAFESTTRARRTTLPAAQQIPGSTAAAEIEPSKSAGPAGACNAPSFRLSHNHPAHASSLRRSGSAASGPAPSRAG